MVVADQLVANIVGQSDSAQGLQALRTWFKGFIASITGRNHLQLLSNALASLDPSAHSLGMLYLLDAQSRSGISLGDLNFIDIASRFFRLCSGEQIRLAPEIMVQLGKCLKEHVLASECPRVGILPLMNALRKLQQSREHVTPLHADFFQLCLLSKVYNAAQEVLHDDIFHVDPHNTCMTPTDLFLYCYYGGMLAAGSKLYGRALELLMQALSAPAVASNAIVLAAYKKMILISLIHSGKSISLPKVTSARMKHFLESEGKAYQELSTAYLTHDPEKLNKCIEQYTPIYTTDNNKGLVNQVSTSLVKRNIQRLTSTYLTLSLPDIASHVGLASPQEAEQHVLQMIEQGQVHAQIDEQDGMVRFLEDPEQYNNKRTAERLDSQIRQSMDLATKMRSVHESVMCDRQYLSKITAKERSRLDVPQDDVQMLYQP